MANFSGPNSAQPLIRIMSAEILDNTEEVLTIRISGKLRQSELVTAQKNAAAILRKRGGSRLLVLAEKFDGWEKGGDWGNLSGQEQLDAQIDRMAIVGEKRWEDVALLFTGKGLRHIEIEYFSPTDLPRARSWLSSPE
jgi:hypothetical protein